MRYVVVRYIDADPDGVEPAFIADVRGPFASRDKALDAGLAQRVKSTGLEWDVFDLHEYQFPQKKED